MEKYFFILTGVILLAAGCQKAVIENNQTAPAIQTGNTEKMKVKVFVIANDNGESGKKIGCGDSVLGLDREVEKSATPLKASLEALLAIKDDYIGESGLYTALGKSNLKLDSAEINNGKAIIKLSGDLVIGGVCDSPRVEAQIRETAMQFSTVKSADILLNGKTLSSYLSDKGETVTIKVFFVPKGSNQLQCDDVVAVNRTVAKNVKIGTVALEELLKGPTEQEQKLGYITQIPIGSKLNYLTVRNGEARADFNQATEMGGGSCAQGIITTQIRKTLLQFATVKTVKLSIDGRTENIFQP